MRTIRNLLLATGLLVAATGCGGDETATAPAAESSVALPDGIFAAEAPADALRITEAAARAAAGDEVTLLGRVGGMAHPFVDGRAVMTIADDQAIAACDARPDDACEMPWDYCCEPPEKIREATATIQVVGADGRPLAAGLEGAGGLVPHAHVVVHGKVAQRADGGVFVVDADAIHVVKTQ